MKKNFFNGRYGLDNLSMILIIFSVIFITSPYIWIIGIAMIGFALFRIFSKNHKKRNDELQKFNILLNKFNSLLAPFVYRIAGWLRNAYFKLKNKISRLQQRKDYVFIRCSSCRKMLRLPRHKGKLSVKCPVCKAEFIKKT